MLGLEKSFDLDSMFLTGKEISYDSLTGGGIGDAYKSSAAAYACIRRQAVDISSVPLRFLSNPDDMKSEIDTPIKGLFEKPNVGTSQEQFLQQIVIMTLLRGDVVTVFDNAHSPTKMFGHFDSKDWKAVVSETEELVGWQYRKGQKKLTRLPTEVLSHRLPTPYDPYRGQSPLTAAANAMNIAKNADAYHSSIVDKGGESGTIYKTSSSLTPAQYSQLLSELKSRRSRGGATPDDFLLHGGLEIVAPSFTSSEVNILSLRSPAVETICQVYGMSPTLIGQANESNYSTFRGYLKIYWLQTLLPFLRGLENSFDGYFAERHGVYVRFDIRAVDSLQDYLGERKDTAKAFYQMGVPMSELNRRLNLGFDTDNIVAGDDCLMPVNMAPMSMLANGEHIPILTGEGDSGQLLPPGKSLPYAGSKNQDPLETTDSKAENEVAHSDNLTNKEAPSESNLNKIKSDNELPLTKVDPLELEKHPSISIPSNRRIARASKKAKGLLRRELLSQKDNGLNPDKLNEIVGQFASKAMLEGCIKALTCVDNTGATFDELVGAVTVEDIDKWEDVLGHAINSPVSKDIDTYCDIEKKDAYNKAINGTSAYLNEIAVMASRTGFQLQLIDLGIDIEKE